MASEIHEGSRWELERALGTVRSVNPSSLSVSRPPNVSVMDVRKATSGAKLFSRSGDGGSNEGLGVTSGALSLVELVSLLKCELCGEPCARIMEVVRKRIGCRGVVSRSGLSGGSGHAGSESSTMMEDPSPTSLPTSSRGSSTADLDTASESTTLAVAIVIAMAPLTLTIVAGVTVIVDIPESRSPGGRAGRRVGDELRSPVSDGARYSPAGEEVAAGEFDVGVVGDCNVTSTPDLGSVIGNDRAGPAAGDSTKRRSEDVDDIARGNEGVVSSGALILRPRPALREETFGPSETSRRRGLSSLFSESCSSWGIEGRFPFGVGGTLLVGGPGALMRSGAPRVMFAPNDTSGRVGKKVPEYDDPEGECEGEGDVDGVDVHVEGE